MRGSSCIHGQWQPQFFPFYRLLLEAFFYPPTAPQKRTQQLIPTGLLAVNGSCHHFFWPGFSIWGQGAALRKIKKKMIHQELISEVLMTLRFPAEAADIKRRIESLIEREWLVGRIPCRKCLRSVAVISEKGDMEHPAGMDQCVTELAWTGFTLYTFFFLWSMSSLVLGEDPLGPRCLERHPPNEQGVTCYTYLAWDWPWPCGLVGSTVYSFLFQQVMGLVHWCPFPEWLLEVVAVLCSSKAPKQCPVLWDMPSLSSEKILLCQKTGLNGLVHGKPTEKLQVLSLISPFFCHQIGAKNRLRRRWETRK